MPDPAAVGTGTQDAENPMRTCKVHVLAACLLWLCQAIAIDNARAAEFEIEAGIRDSADTFVSLDETYVSFSRPFQEVPVVVALIDQRGGNAAMLRITNVSTAGFFAVITEPEGYDGEHLSVNFHYIAMTPGTHRLPGGEIIAAGRHTTTAVQHGTGVAGAESFDTVSFGDTLSSTATVLADLQTAFNESNAIPDQPAAPFMTVAIEGATNSSVRLAIERSESSLGSVTVPETIGWIAFPSGTGDTFTDFDGNTIDWNASLTPTNIRGWTDGCFVNPHGINSASAVVIAKKQTRLEDDGGWFRRCSLSSTTIGLRVDEDRGNDNERSHISEQGGIIAFSDSFHAIFSEQTLAGNVFLDNGTGGGTAHDGVQNGAENGLGAVTVDLLNDATSTVLATTTAAADGSYTLDIPDAAIGQVVRLQALPETSFASVSELPGVLPSLVNPNNFDGQIVFTPAQYDVYTEVNFGQVEQPELTQDRTVTISPGGIARLSHSYTATTSADVTFSTSVTQETPAGAYSITLFRDTDCSGVIDTGELEITSPVNVAEGDQICVVAVTQVSSGAGPGSLLQYDLMADTDLSGIPLVLNTANMDEVQVDIIGILSLAQEVCNVTANTCNALDGTGFSQNNTGNPGDTLQYRIVFTANGPDLVETVNLQGAVPDFSELVPGSPAVAKSPSGLACILVTPPGGGSPGYTGPVEWSCNGGTMAPGEEGIVAFDIQIAL